MAWIKRAPFTPRGLLALCLAAPSAAVGQGAQVALNFGVTIWGASDPGLLDLGALGMPGCQLRTSLDAVVGPWSPSGSAYTYGLSVPANNALIGATMYTQAATFAAPAVNPFGAITSNGVAGVVGSF